MNQYKKGMPNHQYSCEICKINSMSNAEYALHEFTKKHCDNLIRVAKNKPILKKKKTKNKIPEIEKEIVKVNTEVHSGSFTKCGYFDPVESLTAANRNNHKKFNSDNDLYLQKFAESSFKEETTPLIKEECQQSQIAIVTSVGRVPKKKKKKKSNIKMCHICNVALLTTPTYMAHMKSLEHISKLKVSGMGVSAHFVKSSSDLHTIKTKEDQKVCQDLISVKGNSNEQDSSCEFSLLNCNTSEFAFHSLNQNSASVGEKYHMDRIKRKAENKKIEISKSEKLVCYTCNKSLNTLFQYNEHKNGKKHKSKCKALVKKGLTIPPEERIPEVGISNNDIHQPIYPPRYVMMIAERQKFICPTIEHCTGSSNTNSILESLAKSDLCDQNIRLTNFNKESGDNMVRTGIQDEINYETKVPKPVSNYELVKKSNFIFHKINFVPAKTNERPNSENRIIVLSSEESLCCSICNEHFQCPFQFDTHLTREEHLKKIVELKVSGKDDQEILDLIFADRNIIKPTNAGNLLCSICKVTANSELEFKQHLSCLLHKYMKKDYKKKITLEVKELIPCDETGMYYCKVCKIKLISLVEFSHHIFSAEHKNIQKKEGSFGSPTLTQDQRFGQNLKRKYILLQSPKTDENPEERKACDMVADLCTDAESKVPNLKLLESKIETTKNVNVGLNEKSDSLKDRNKLRTLSNKNRQKWFSAGVQVQQHSFMQANSGPLLLSLTSNNFLPRKNHSRFFNSLPFNSCPPRVGNSPPIYNSHAFEFRPFCEKNFH